MSIVRNNLLTRLGYVPYCGNDTCFSRTQFDGWQFKCRCGWRSAFEPEFIEQYKAAQKKLITGLDAELQRVSQVTGIPTAKLRADCAAMGDAPGVMVGEAPSWAEVAQWLHAAYDRPPQTPEVKAMLARVDTAASGVPASQADERMRHDYPILQQFHTKHALGALAAPSCLCCGQQTHPITRPIAVQHMELPAIVVCKQCKDAAAGVTGTQGDKS